jgi:hypothetical protein
MPRVWNRNEAAYQETFRNAWSYPAGLQEKMGFSDEDSSRGEISFQDQEPGREKAGAARESGEISAAEEK